jgi:hypothetical protein
MNAGGIEALRWRHEASGVAVPAHDTRRDVGRGVLEKSGGAGTRDKLKVWPWTMGLLAAIVVDPKTGVLSAGTDPRVDARDRGSREQSSSPSLRSSC